MSRSMYYEDFELPFHIRSTGRTITETDLTMQSMLSGDWAPIHCDEVYARGTRFGRRILAGVFGLSLVAGVYTRWGIFEESGIAMLSIDDWRFHQPIFIGDTLCVEMVIAGKHLTKNGNCGVLERDLSIINQEGEVVQSGRSPLLVARRGGAVAAELRQV